MKRQNPAMAGASRWWRMAAASLAGGAAVMLAGCGAGQVTQTGDMPPAVNGAEAQLAALHISDAALRFPDDGRRFYRAGADIPLSMSIANDGTRDDRIESATSPAGDVSIEGDRVIAAGRALTIGWPVVRDPGQDAATDSGEVGHAGMTLTHLSHELRPGQVVTVTLTFRESGSVALPVPIAAPGQ